MKKLMYVLILATYFSTQILASGGIKWVTFDEGLTQAKTQNKFLLVDFFTDWCKWCKVMDEKTYSDAGVQKTISKNFVMARVNPEKPGTVHFMGQEYQNSQFAQAAGVTGYPSTGIFSSDGNFITLVTGYLDIPKFNSLVKYLKQGHYKKLAFEDYSFFENLQNKLAESPKDSGLNFVVGYFYDRVLKDNSHAVKYYKKAIRYNSKFKEAYAALSGVYTNLGKTKSAKKMMKQAKNNGFSQDSEILAKVKEIIQKVMS
jgi:thioredoxin-related protein